MTNIDKIVEALTSKNRRTFNFANPRRMDVEYRVDFGGCIDFPTATLTFKSFRVSKNWMGDYILLKGVNDRGYSYNLTHISDEDANAILEMVNNLKARKQPLKVN